MTLLKLDLDGPIPRGFFFRLMHCMKLWRWHLKGVRYDRTRRGWHITAAVAETVSPSLTVAAQAILGSDLKREAFNLMRVQHPRDDFFSRRWNVLYSSHSRGVKLAS